MSLRSELQKNSLNQAIIHINDIRRIIHGNRYEIHMVKSLNDLQGELTRQLTNLKNSNIMDL